MIVYLWRAGSAEGVTDDSDKARSEVARYMLMTGTAEAIVEAAYYDEGIRSLEAGYAKVDRPHWIARCQHGGGVTWSSHG